MRYQETAIGPAYELENGPTIIFAYGTGPHLVWGDGKLTRIMAPGRFGDWRTPEQRREYVKAYAAG